MRSSKSNRRTSNQRTGNLGWANLRNLLAVLNSNSIREDEAFIAAGYRLRETESVEKDREGGLKYFSNSLTGVIENGFVLPEAKSSVAWLDDDGWEFFRPRQESWYLVR